MSERGVYSSPHFSACGGGRYQDAYSSEDSERSDPPVWESAVDSRGELFYAEVEDAPPSPTLSGGREPGEACLPSRPPQPPAASASASGKLRHLLRRRRSQKVGRGELTVAGPLSPQRRAPAGPAQEAPTPAGEVYGVVVRLASEPPAQPGPLCESLLGLIGLHQLQPADLASCGGGGGPAGAASCGGGGGPQTVTVAALAPRGPLIRNPAVHVGDRLERVNGVPVSPSSLQGVLAALPRPGKVRLSFRRAASQPGNGSGGKASLTNGTARTAAAGVSNSNGGGIGTTTNTTPTTIISTATSTSPSTSTPGTSAGDGRVTSLTGDGLRLEELGQLLRGVPYGLLCLSTAGLTETSPERQDIVYQFPGYDTALLSARGALLTVAGLTRQISGDSPLRAAVTVGGTAVHVAVACQEDLVLLLAAPEASLSSPELHQLGAELWQLLQIEFGSLRRAFLEPSQRPYVDHLLALVFQQALLTPELTSDLPGARPQRQPGGLDRLLSAAHAMHLPRHVQVLIDDSLTELESGDFGEESEDFYGLERLYLLRGSALYYKGYLVASHLPPEDQAAVHLLLRHRQLLTRSRRSRWRQLVVWRRYRRPPAAAAARGGVAAGSGAGGTGAGPGAGAGPGGAPGVRVGPGVGAGSVAGAVPGPGIGTGSAAENGPSGGLAGETAGEGYGSEDLEHYLLVVGAKHALLAVLLESGGCTVQQAENTGPDSIYVEEAQATLFQLESMGIMDMCESWLGGSPSLASSAEEDQLPGGARLYEGTARDALLETRWWSRLVAARRTDSRRSRASHELPNRGDGAASLEEPRSGGGRAEGASGRREAADSPAGSAADFSGDAARPHSRSQSDDGSSTDDSAADTWEIYRGPPKSRLLPNQYDLMENKKIYMGQALEDSRRVVADSLSVALQHVLLDVPAGCYLALPEPLLASWLRPPLMAAFSRAVARLLRQLTPGTPVAGGFSGSPAAGAPKEVGTMFTLDGQEGQTFWVVGRQMSPPSGRQLFVCVPGTTPPNMLELAFRLSHGTGPW